MDIPVKGVDDCQLTLCPAAAHLRGDDRESPGTNTK
jgi:hypothetical protein